jgi:hypothetical protein
LAIAMIQIGSGKSVRNVGRAIVPTLTFLKTNQKTKLEALAVQEGFERGFPNGTISARTCRPH